jgi:hypothetical protein
MLNFLIFSKNRACQLDLLLRNIKYLFGIKQNTVNVLYTYSGIHEDSYNCCKIEHSKINWIFETNFEKQTKELISSHRYTCLLTDDTTFFRDFFIPFYPKENECFSWRLGYNTIVQDHVTKTLQPILIPDYYCDDIISWNPNNYPNWCNWGYPFSFDGHVYLSKTLLNILKDKNFNSTNDMEGILHNNRNIINKIYSNVHSSCVNIPCNNLSGLTQYGVEHEYSMDFLNHIYMSGKRISPIQGLKKPINACHQELEFNFYLKEG